MGKARYGSDSKVISLDKKRKLQIKKTEQEKINEDVTLHIQLIISSCFFMIPGIYAFTHDILLLGVLSSITTLVSINYWRHAVEGWRRNADLFVAKLSFCIYFIIGVIHVRDFHILLVGWPNTFLILGSYYLSNVLWEKNIFIWHFIFLYQLVNLLLYMVVMLFIYNNKRCIIC